MVSGIGIKFDQIREIDIKTVGRIKQDAELVAESIHRIINTRPFERPREPFGCRIKEVVFDPNDFTTSTLASFFVADALERFEPRADIEQIISRRSNDNENLLIIRIVFRLVDDPTQLLATNVTVNL